jgi:hypothetical protein
VAKYRLKSPESGIEHEVPADHLAEAISDGGIPLGPIELISPESGKKFAIPAERIREALDDGAIVPGSTKHRASEMGGLEAFGRRAVDSGLMGFSDEVGGAFRALLGEDYKTARDDIRQANDAAGENLGGLGAGVADVLGGVAPLLLTGGAGLLGKGAIAGGKQAIARSAAAGGIAGAGYSEAEDLAGVAGDALQGGLIGAGTELVLPRVMRGGRRVVQSAKEGIAEAFDPNVQRAIAAGAGAKDLRKGFFREKVLGSGKTLNELGVFDGGDLTKVTPDPKTGVKLEFDKSRFASRPDKRALDDRLSKVEDVVGPAIKDQYTIATAQGASAGNVFDDVIARLGMQGNSFGELETLMRNSSPGTRQALEDKAGEWILRIQRAGQNFDFTELHEIKKSLVKDMRLNVEKGTENNTAEVARTIYGALNDSLKDKVDAVAKQTGNATLSRLNEIYSAAATYRRMLDTGIAFEERQPRLFGVLKQSSATAGAMGATIGASIGGAGGAAIGATAGNAMDQIIASTEGRLKRAAMADGIAKQFGKIPRAANAVRNAINQNPQIFVPILGPQGWKAVKNLPDHVWRQQARVLMPMLAQSGLFEDSPFQSELDGQVSDGPDKFIASQKIDQGFDTGEVSPSKAYLDKKRLVKDGTLPEELLPQTAEQIMARVRGM